MLYQVFIETPKRPRGASGAVHQLFKVRSARGVSSLAAFCRDHDINYCSMREQVLARSCHNNPQEFNALFNEMVARRGARAQRAKCPACGKPGYVADTKLTVDKKPVSRSVPAGQFHKNWPVHAVITAPLTPRGALRVAVSRDGKDPWYHLSALTKALKVDLSTVLMRIAELDPPRGEVVDISNCIWPKEEIT